MSMTSLLSGISADQLEAFGSRVITRYAECKLPSVTKMELFLTENCTLQCDYCFVNDKDHSKRMCWETARKAVDFLIDNSPSSSSLAITFFGGEPLMEFALMKQTTAYARQRSNQCGKRIAFSLTTNGTIVNQEIARFGREHGFNLLVSIDGDREAHDRHRVYAGSRKGCWDTVVGRNFSLLKSIQGWMGARVTPTPDTVRHLSSGVRKLFSLGVNQFIIGPDMDVEWNHDEMEILSLEMQEVVGFYIETKRKGLPIRMAAFETSIEELQSTYSHVWGCDAGITRVAVSTEGDLYPCCKFVNPFPGMQGYKLGTVYAGFTNLEARMDFIKNRVGARQKCTKCDISEACNGGCPANNLHMGRSLVSPGLFECFNKRLYLRRLARIPKEMTVQRGERECA